MCDNGLELFVVSFVKRHPQCMLLTGVSSELSNPEDTDFKSLVELTEIFVRLER